jgi:hypothetical protein
VTPLLTVPGLRVCRHSSREESLLRL